LPDPGLVIFDKTGTLTRGSPAVSEVAAAPGTTEDDLIALERSPSKYYLISDFGRDFLRFFEAETS
jgi:high-affinity K+ transport system ATPase subunit B